MLLAMLLSGASYADGPGGVGLNFVGEFDTQGSEFLVEATADPVTTSIQGLAVDLFSTELSWGIAPRVDRFDRLSLAGVRGQKLFGADTVAGFWLGNILYEQDFRMFELGLVGGDLLLPLRDSGFDLSLGGDIRMRDLGSAFGEDWSIFLGVPLGLQHTWRLPKEHWAISSGVRVRPSLGLLGKTAFIVDAEGSIALRYSAIAEEAIRLDLYVEDTIRYDSFTDVDLALEDRFILGMNVRF